jgi:class 3 adenylate cyclase
VASFDGPARAARCGLAICDAARAAGISVRAGVHTGECERLAGDLAGIAVHIAARVCAVAEPSQVLATGTVRELSVGSTLTFAPQDERELRGVPGAWRLFAVQEAPT